MFRKLAFLFLLPILCWGCSEEIIPVTDDAGRSYYPVSIGDYWIYDVSETKYIRRFKDQPGDSVTYQLRERVDTVYQDQTNQLTYKLIRSRRANALQPWGADSVVLINKSGTNLQITRNNLRTINLIFPVAEGKKWNGNAFNFKSTGEEEFNYQNTGSPFSIRDTTFANTITVVQYNNENLINLNDRLEIYAAGVGLIYKKNIDYEYCNNGSTQSCEIGKGFILYGKKRIQKIRSFHVKN
jgi:hypothetical protein